VTDPAATVTVADDLLPHADWRTTTDVGEGDPSLLVLSHNPEGAARALARIADRFYLVAADGVEYTAEQWDAARPGWGNYPPETPSWVTVRLMAEGAVIVVDSDFELYPAMLRTMVAMVLDALQENGVNGHVVQRQPDDDLWERSSEYQPSSGEA
jgi:hypothetical protein